MTAKLSWGILATGGIARKFAAGLSAARTGRLVAVGSRSRSAAERFAADFPGTRAHGSYEALLADPAVTAVYIANPHPGHPEWAIKAAAAGKHILCEKPLALNRADAERMVAAARTHQVFLMEAFMYRCHPQTAKLADLVRDGAIGELRAIHADFTVPFKFDPAHRLFSKALGGGAILDLGCYPISFSRRLAGAALGRTFAEPLSLQGSGRLNAVTGADEYAAATIAYPGGITAQVSCSSCTAREVRARLLGTTGWIDVPAPFHPGGLSPTAEILVHRNDGTAPEKIELACTQPLYALEADTVGDAIARGELEAAAMSHADSLGNMAVLDQWRAAVGMKYDGE